MAETADSAGPEMGLRLYWVETREPHERPEAHWVVTDSVQRAADIIQRANPSARVTEVIERKGQLCFDAKFVRPAPEYEILS